MADGGFDPGEVETGEAVDGLEIQRGPKGTVMDNQTADGPIGS